MNYLSMLDCKLNKIKICQHGNYQYKGVTAPYNSRLLLCYKMTNGPQVQAHRALCMIISLGLPG